VLHNYVVIVSKARNAVSAGVSITFASSPEISVPDDQSPTPQNGQQPPLPYGLPKRPTEPLAIWGLVASFVFWPAGLVLSIMASKKIKHEGGEGAGLSLAGLIVSIVAGALTMIITVAIVLISAAAVTTIGSVAAAVDALPTDRSYGVPSAPADGELGSRTAPMAYGDWLQLPGESGAVEWETAIGASNWDATAVPAAGEYNEVALAGQVFDSTFACIDNEASDLTDLYRDGEATGNMVFLLPADALTGGTWSVSYGWLRRSCSPPLPERSSVRERWPGSRRRPCR